MVSTGDRGQSKFSGCNFNLAAALAGLELRLLMLFLLCSSCIITANDNSPAQANSPVAIPRTLPVARPAAAKASVPAATPTKGAAAFVTIPEIISPSDAAVSATPIMVINVA